MTKKKRMFVKHISREGARYHVLSWYLVDGQGKRRCSEPNCEVNYELIPAKKSKKKGNK